MKNCKNCESFSLQTFSHRYIMIVVEFDRCAGPPLLQIILQNLEMLWLKEEPIYYDKLMQKRILKECYLLLNSFPTRPATFTHSNKNTWIYTEESTFTQQQQHSHTIASTLHTVTDTYTHNNIIIYTVTSTFTDSGSIIYTQSRRTSSFSTNSFSRVCYDKANLV